MMNKRRAFLLNTTTWSGGREQRRAMCYAFDNAYMKHEAENDVERAVFTALDNAIRKNGYTFTDMSAMEIADDLNRYAADIDTFELEDVVKAVEAYFAE